MELLYFKHLKRLINNYINNSSSNKYTELMMIFVDLYYTAEELKFISYNLENNMSVFIDFVGVLAFKKNINFFNLTYITDEELYQLDSITFDHEEINYDDNLKYQIYKEIITKNKN